MLRLTLVGVGCGLAAAFFLTRFLAKLLFDVPQTDLATFASVSLCLGGVVLLASYIPARVLRASIPWWPYVTNRN